MADYTGYVSVLVSGRSVFVEPDTVKRLGIDRETPGNKSFLPDELGFHDANIGSLVRQGIEPSEFQIPKFRLTAEYALAQAKVLAVENQGLRTGSLYQGQ